jgi:hypothetical protein
MSKLLGYVVVEKDGDYRKVLAWHEKERDARRSFDDWKQKQALAPDILGKYRYTIGEVREIEEK